MIEPEFWQRRIGPSESCFCWMVYRGPNNVLWFEDEDEARRTYDLFRRAYLEEKNGGRERVPA